MEGCQYKQSLGGKKEQFIKITKLKKLDKGFFEGLGTFSEDPITQLHIENYPLSFENVLNIGFPPPFCILCPGNRKYLFQRLNRNSF